MSPIGRIPTATSRHLGDTKSSRVSGVLAILWCQRAERGRVSGTVRLWLDGAAQSPVLRQNRVRFAR
jgi:hypothetical protein